MNLTAIILVGGSIAALPLTTLADIRPANPFDGLSVAAAGISIEVGADGLEAKAADHTDFQIELRLKSGAPIRVRL